MSKSKRQSQHKCSPETVEKLAEAVRCVLAHGWGGHWSFLKPCQDAMEAYKSETDLCKCGKIARVSVHKSNDKEIRACWDCFIKIAECFKLGHPKKHEKKIAKVNAR